MKKWQILIPSVMVAATPLVSLTACNKAEGVKFTMNKELRTSGSLGWKATSTLNWKPGSHVIDFVTSAATFEWDGGECAAGNVEILPSKQGIAVVTIQFNGEVSQTITDGVLKFKYNDVTAKTKGKWKTITGITVTVDS